MYSHGPQAHKQVISGQGYEDQVQPWHSNLGIFQAPEKKEQCK